MKLIKLKTNVVLGLLLTILPALVPNEAWGQLMISNATVNGSGCPGNTILINYLEIIPSGQYQSNIELSDKNGSFANVVNLQNISSGFFWLSGTIPSGLPYGTGYRVRITKKNTSTLTIYTSNANSSDLTINEVPNFNTCGEIITGGTSLNDCAGTVVFNKATSLGSPSTSYSYVLSGSTTGNGTGTGSGATFNKGTTSVTITPANACGAGDTCTINVVVQDNTAPQIFAPSDLVINGYCAPGAPRDSIFLGAATAFDNCGSYTITNNAPAIFPTGVHTTVTWTATDSKGNQASANQDVLVNPGYLTTSSVITPEYPVVGQEEHTVYLGYPSGSPSISFTISPSGGTTPYKYEWQVMTCSTSAYSTINNTSNSFTFEPTTADTCSFNGDNWYDYWVKITDAHNCSVYDAASFNVVNPYVGTIGNSNLLLCHKMRTRGRAISQLLSLAPSQTGTHLQHGDQLGHCEPILVPIKQLSAEGDDKEVLLYPNPSNGLLSVELSSISEEADITISDITGRIIAHKVLAVDQASTASFDLSSNAPGVYLVQVRDGKFSYFEKLILK